MPSYSVNVLMPGDCGITAMADPIAAGTATASSEEAKVTRNPYGTAEMASTPATLAHKMVYFIYDRQACEKETWEISFWNEFRRTNADVTMDAKSLRTFFFHGIMQNSDYLEDLRREVLKYINPLFNRLRQEVLEFRDLVEGIDYVHDQPHTVTLEENRLPPLQLQSCHQARTTPTSVSSKRFVTPSPAQIQSFVADEMSELVWIEEERSSNQTLSINECLQRMAMLTHQGIPLKDCIEPGMKCFERFSTHNESTRMLRQELP
ncbi:uncharacterized protein LOC128724705 [Anopheles nili]|uniref:uncharacterized protein LOC128724705 n=1 Tax=Anopheles nili TaxID=185578 RepID=UPI00237B20F3|nr:uncharacterized protein LOC128724705 [Anopheles nili]